MSITLHTNNKYINKIVDVDAIFLKLSLTTI